MYVCMCSFIFLYTHMFINPGLPHCRQILNQLSHKGNPRILEWVPYPFSSRSSQPQESNWGAVKVGSLPTELSGKP